MDDGSIESATGTSTSTSTSNAADSNNRSLQSPDLVRETLSAATTRTSTHCPSHDADADVDVDDEGATSEIMLPLPVFPRNNKEYGTKEYWERRFLDEESFEWLLSYQQVRHQLEPILLQQCCCHSDDYDDDSDAMNNCRHEKSQARILIVGCGNAPFSLDLYEDGYTNITNIDYSSVVIQNMQQLHGQKYPHMRWITMDMTQMEAFHDAAFDVVIDKAAMDAIMTNEQDVWNPNIEVVRTVYQMCHHVSRILPPNFGTYIQISLSQPHFRSKYLLHLHSTDDDTDLLSDTRGTGTQQQKNSNRTNEYRYCTQFGWTVHSEPAGRSDDEVAEPAFGHFLYIMTKVKKAADS